VLLVHLLVLSTMFAMCLGPLATDCWKLPCVAKVQLYILSSEVEEWRTLFKAFRVTHFPYDCLNIGTF